jgi:ABC-type multidrug transport system fused ATPase/permease subunit
VGINAYNELKISLSRMCELLQIDVNDRTAASMVGARHLSSGDDGLSESVPWDDHLTTGPSATASAPQSAPRGFSPAAPRAADASRARLKLPSPPPKQRCTAIVVVKEMWASWQPGSGSGGGGSSCSGGGGRSPNGQHDGQHDGQYDGQHDGQHSGQHNVQHDGMVLRDVNFSLSAGEAMAVFGPVGSGKSSLLLTLLDELEPEAGTVRIAGLATLYAPQKPWIFPGTVRDNISFTYKYEAEWMAVVVDACALTRDIALFDGGIDTEIGERGVTLSGGQKARLSMARAIYGTRFAAREAGCPCLVLLDDPFSALDPKVGP